MSDLIERVVMLAGLCGKHHEKGCDACISSQEYTNTEILRLHSENARLRGLVVDAKSTVDDAAKLYGDDDLQNCADNILGAALEQK